MIKQDLKGVYVASLTPLDEQLNFDRDGLIKLLNFYAERGCHGTLLLGTTGEGTSFDAKTRKSIWQTAIEIKKDYPDFKLLAGTGTPALNQTIAYNKLVFDLGYDGVVVLPPYYLKNATEEGLYKWFAAVINSSVPSDGNFLGYHIPQVSGIGLSIPLLKKLRDNFPNQFVGLKDSTGDINHAKKLIEELPESVILVGNDKILLPALEIGASGCITAGANIVSPLLRKVWDDFENEINNQEVHEKLQLFRAILDQHPPLPSSLKSMMNQLFDLPDYDVLPPLEKYSPEKLNQALAEISALIN